MGTRAHKPPPEQPHVPKWARQIVLFTSGAVGLGGGYTQAPVVRVNSSFAVQPQRRGGDAWIEEKLANTLKAAMADYERLDFKPFHIQVSVRDFPLPG